MGALNVRTTDDDEELIRLLAIDFGASQESPADRSLVVKKCLWDVGQRKGHVARKRLVKGSDGTGE